VFESRAGRPTARARVRVARCVCMYVQTVKVRVVPGHPVPCVSD
jgi:hypothetical protein